MTRPLPLLMGADWNEAIGTFCVTVEVPEKHLNTPVFRVEVGSMVLVAEDEEMLGSTGTVIELFVSDSGTTYAVVDISEN